MVDSQGKSLDSAGGGDFIYEYAINYNWHGPGLLCLDNLYNFFLENHPYLCQWLGVIARLWSWSRDIDDTFLRYLEPDGKMPVPWLMVAVGLISEPPNEVARTLSRRFLGMDSHLEVALGPGQMRLGRRLRSAQLSSFASHPTRWCACQPLYGIGLMPLFGAVCDAAFDVEVPSLGRSQSLNLARLLSKAFC